MGPGRRRRGRWFPRFLAALLCIVLLLPAAVVLPFRWIPPPATSFMLQYGLAHGGYDYRWRGLEHISPCLPAAVVAAEDQKFAGHFGFDLASIRDALANRHQRLRGASTISQQTAKNLYLWPGRSFVRKGLEAWLTAYLELLWPKRRILEMYVNVAEFGPGVYGAQAASTRFFGKDAADLSVQEAALLAAVLPSPRRLSAPQPSAYVLERAQWIRRQMQYAAGCGAVAEGASTLGALADGLQALWRRLRTR